MHANALKVDVPQLEVQGAFDFEWSPVVEPPAANLQTLWEVLRGPSQGTPAAIPIDRNRVREVETWAYRLVQAAVDVTIGIRPATQLVRWTSPQVYRELSHGPRARGAMRPRVVSTRAQLRGPIAEVAVHLRAGERGFAAAARLQQNENHWTCTVLDIARPVGWFV